jgi:hypothetical protein
MVIGLKVADLDECTITSNTTWDKLYCILESQVKDWVGMAHLSLWRGQEEDVIADIVQEAITRTYTDCAKDSSREEVISWSTLRDTGIDIARRCYRDLECRDGQFVRAPLHGSARQEYCVIYERIHRSEREQDKAIPTAVLRNSTQEPVMSAVKQRRESLLKGIQRNRCKKHRNKEGTNRCSRLTTTSGYSAADTIENVPELAMLAARLDTTAPYAVINPAFFENLRMRLLKILVEHQEANTGETLTHTPPQAVGMQDNPYKEEQTEAKHSLPLPAIPMQMLSRDFSSGATRLLLEQCL